MSQQGLCPDTLVVILLVVAVLPDKSRDMHEGKKVDRNSKDITGTAGSVIG